MSYFVQSLLSVIVTLFSIVMLLYLDRNLNLERKPEALGICAVYIVVRLLFFVKPELFPLNAYGYEIFTAVVSYTLAGAVAWMLSNRKKKGLYHALMVSFLAEVFSMMRAYAFVFYSVHFQYGVLLVPVIIYILYLLKMTLYTNYHFIFNIVCLLVWSVLCLVYLTPNFLTSTAFFIEIAIFFIWMFGQKALVTFRENPVF